MGQVAVRLFTRREGLLKRTRSMSTSRGQHACSLEKMASDIVGETLSMIHSLLRIPLGTSPAEITFVSGSHRMLTQGSESHASSHFAVLCIVVAILRTTSHTALVLAVIGAMEPQYFSNTYCESPVDVQGERGQPAWSWIHQGWCVGARHRHGFIGPPSSSNTIPTTVPVTH